MSLRHRLYAWLAVMHALALGGIVWLLRDRPVLMLALEVGVLCSLMIGLRLVRRALAPLGYTRHFHDLLQDQHYAARLQGGSDAELGELVDLFNTMLKRLYQERLQLGEQQGFLDRLLEATPSAVIVFDFDGKISLLNASALALAGAPVLAPAGAATGAATNLAASAVTSTTAGTTTSATSAATGTTAGTTTSTTSGAAAPRGQTLRALAGDDRTGLLAQLDALPLGDSRLLTAPNGRRYRGQRGQFHDRGFARHFLLVEELTEELESSEKSTYDKLIRVLAHEVNNTVAATGSVLDSLLYYRDQLQDADGADFATAIGAVKQRNVRLGEFIERFTQVVRMPAPELRPCAPQDILDDILYLYREPCRSRAIHLGWARCDAVAPLPLDRQLLEQALLNVVKNAMEAVEQAGGAKPSIEFVLARDADGVRLAVIDSANLLGAVPAELLFTPFFTTKKGGQGIGLLFVREVMKLHGFAYRLAATGDGRTVFEVVLAR
jgi:two-component system, NtrC family, nitrogen regulation sensor histidine kinase NtrY